MQESQETGVRSLGGEDPLEDGMATHSSILAWRIPVDRGACRATAYRVAQSQTQLKELSMHARVSFAVGKVFIPSLHFEGYRGKSHFYFPLWYLHILTY